MMERGAAGQTADADSCVVKKKRRVMLLTIVKKVLLRWVSVPLSRLTIDCLFGVRLDEVEENRGGQRRRQW
jgi:hypothetical protein